jgi:hypothetical protein
VVKRERDERKSARERRIREYFFGRPGNVLQPATQTVRADTLKVFRIGEARPYYETGFIGPLARHVY